MAKITCTIASTAVVYGTFEGEEFSVKQIILGGKRTSAQAKKIIDEAYKCESLIKPVSYTEKKYSMEESDFMRYAKPVTETPEDAQTSTGAIRMIAKLMLNSLYGKLAINN